MPRVLPLAWALAQTPVFLGAAEPTVPRFVAGDSVVLVGDSITNSGLWHKQALIFYATRYPTERFALHNCGLSGERAAGALRRFDRDIAVHRPTIALVMLGMNDVSRDEYGPRRDTPAAQAAQAEALAVYTRLQGELASRLRRLGARLVLVTPTPYDQTGHQETPALVGVNEALGRCAGILRGLAPQYQAAILDFHGPMTALNAVIQARDPEGTLIGKDRVHPGEPGHLVMAYHLLRAQGVDGLVSAVTLDAATATVVTATNAAVRDLTGGATGLTFTLDQRSLPFPVEGEARKALTLVPFAADLNRETLTVRGLAPGTYTLEIDGASVATVPASAFAAGLDLALNERTPQYRQALEVRAIADRRAAVVGRLRTVEAVWNTHLATVAGLRDDDAPAIERILAEVEAKYKARSYDFGLWQLGQYRQDVPRRATLQAEVDTATNALWAAAQPRPHVYRIAPAAP